MIGLPPWASRGLLTGMMLGLPTVLGVALAVVFPRLQAGWTVVLLPLLAAGPVATVGLRPVQAMLSIVVASALSAGLAAASLVSAGFLLPHGSPASWAPVVPASSSSAPLLMHALAFPLSLLSVSPLAILAYQPALAVLLGGLTLLGREITGCGQQDTPPSSPRGIGPASARGQVLLASGFLLLSLLAASWIGFSALQESRARGQAHPVFAAWKHDLAEIEATLDAELLARSQRRDDAGPVALIRRSLARMADPQSMADLPINPTRLAELHQEYAQSLGLLAASYTAHRALPDNASAIRSVRSSIGLMRQQIHEEEAFLAVADDLAQRHSLIGLILLLAMAGTIGLWLTQCMLGSIANPLADAAAHLSRVSRGDLSPPAPAPGASELRSIVESTRIITEELTRLGAIERASHVAAEMKTIQEQLLNRASTALVAATDADRVFQVTVKSAVALARQPGKVRALAAVGPVSTMAVVAADGEGMQEMLGATMDLRRLLDGPNPELQQRCLRALDLGMPNAIEMFGFRPKAGSIIVTTLRARGGKLTAILVDSDETLGDECAEGLAKLGVDVSLALDSAAFQEDMHVKRSEARFRSLVQHSTDVVMIIQPDGVIQYQSPSGERVLGYQDTALIGANLRDLIHPSDLQKLKTLMADMDNSSERTPRVEWRIHHANGSWIYAETTGNNLLHDPDVSGLVLNSRDIGERRALQDQLTYQAFHDPLTTLPNRALFTDRLERAVLRADRREQAVAMLFLDLDNFKVINDSLGHQAGDEMLVEAARRLVECVRAEDTVARLGGDEFTILIEDANSMDNALDVARRIAQRLRDPFTVLGREVFSTASIGIAVSGPTVKTAADLLRDADLAMYRAKSEGKSRHVVFDGAMNAQAMKRLELETALRRAVERGELRLVYQPIMALDSMGMDRVETLVRWLHPERGLISPADFIPLAEETGLIVPIGQWILTEGCRQAQAWRDQFPGAPDTVLSVNLSPRQFQHPTLVEDISRIVHESHLDPELLELEITEGAVMADADAARKTLQRLRDLGISLAIDDFGTGYSSLGYLKRFPVSVLKIDQSFVRGLGHDEQDSAIVHGVIALAQSLNLSVTAEGIETLEQLARLRDLGCNHGQGYLLSRPLTGEAIGNLLARSTVQLPSPKHGLLRESRRAS